MFLGNVYLTTVKNWINYPVFTFAWFCYGWSKFASIITHKRVEYFISTLSTLALIMILGYLIYKNLIDGNFFLFLGCLLSYEQIVIEWHKMYSVVFRCFKSSYWIFKGFSCESFTDDHDEFIHLVDWGMDPPSDDHLQKTGARGLCGKSIFLL